MPKHVAIVGCGFTGTTAFYQLVHGYPVERITVFESSGDFGPGFPYKLDESSEYLLNNTNDTMCLEPTNRRAFVEWLQRHPRYARGLDEKGNMPRAVYGEFLRDVILRTGAAAKERGIRVKLVPQEVVDLDEDEAGTVTLFTGEDAFEADMAILAIGRCPDVDRFHLQGFDGRSYFATHMPGQKLDEIPLDAECHVIGASLSAYDAVNQLFSAASGCEFVPDGKDRLRFVANGNDRRVVLCSRSGRLKKAQSRYPFPVDLQSLRDGHLEHAGRGTLTLADLLRLMEHDANAAGVHIDRAAMADPYAGIDDDESLNRRAAEILAADIDAATSPPDSPDNYVVDYLDAAQFELWDLFAARVLSAEQEALFRAKYETAFLSYAAPCPVSTAQKVLALMDGGRLRIVGGVRSISTDHDARAFRIEHRFGIEQAHHIINATGAVDRNVDSTVQPTLVRNLAEKGTLRPYRIGEDGGAKGIDVDMHTFAASPGGNVHVANMFLWGPGLYVSSAVMMATIVARVLATAFARESAQRSPSSH